MLLTPDQARTIAELSPFALFVFITVFIGVGLYRRWWVFGWLYLQERDGRVTAETQAERNADALEANNVAMGAQSSVMAQQARELAGLRREIRELRNELARLRRGDHA